MINRHTKKQNIFILHSLGHDIKLCQNTSQLPNLDVFNIVRIARQRGGQSINLAHLPSQHFQS